MTTLNFDKRLILIPGKANTSACRISVTCFAIESEAMWTFITLASETENETKTKH